MLAAGLVGASSVPAPAADLRPAPAAMCGWSAMQAYVDPQTGEFAAEGPALAMPSSQPLHAVTEERSPVAGRMVRLRGRYVNALVARIGADGAERVGCIGPDGTAVPDATR